MAASETSAPSTKGCSPTEQGAINTCLQIGYPIAECWITFAQDCSTADQAAAYKHCMEVMHLPAGSDCQLQWR